MPIWTKAEKLRLAGFVNSHEASPFLVLPINRTNLPPNRDGRRKLLSCIYASLIEKNIRYSFEKYKPEEQYQEIRTPKEILEAPKEGTCLDLSVLFCSLCLANELLPIIILTKGHAFVAVSLDHGLRSWNDFSRSENSLFEEQDFVADISEITKLVDAGKYLAVECTGFAGSEILSPEFPEGKGRTNGFLSFNQAIEAGREQLTLAARPFVFALDIATTQFYKGVDIVAPEPNSAKLNPFKLLESYTAADTKNFFGRKTEIQNIVDAVENYSYVFVCGETGVGKTSLLSAGVTKELFRRDSSHKIIQISNYSRSLENFSEVFAPIENKKIIYIFDQFEDIIDPAIDETKRENFLKEIIEFQNSSQAKLIIATSKYVNIKDYFDHNNSEKIEIGLLNQDEAKNVIHYSLEQNGFTIPTPEKITKLVIPELERINTESKEFLENKGIYPPLLQIVCYKLTEIAKNDCNNIIGEILFDNYYKSAEQILKNYIEEELKQEFPNEVEFDQMIQVLDSILTTDIKEWFSSEDLLKNEFAESAYIEKTLGKLHTISLLKKRVNQTQYLYSLSAPWVFILINLIADEKLKYQNLARIGMRTAWKAWIMGGQLASSEQVKSLSPYIKLLQLEPIELLFLLRSAVERKLQVTPYLEAFSENEQLRNFACHLENPPSQISGTNLQSTKLLLNYSAEKPISENAVSNESPQVRQTSALLLTVISNNLLFKRVSAAFKEIDDKLLLLNISGSQKKSLLSELRGIITETYPDDSGKINRDQLNKSIQFRIYCWLLKRRFELNKEFILKTALGGAVTASIGVGIEWALFPAIKDIAYKFFDFWNNKLVNESGNYLIIGIVQGLFLGSLLVLGFVSSVIFLDKSKKISVKEYFQSAEINWKEWFFIIGSGDALFTGAHTLLSYLAGCSLSNLPYSASVGSILGLTGGVGYLISQKYNNLLGSKSWILGGYVTAALCALLQYTLISNGEIYNGIQWVWTSDKIQEDINLPFEFWRTFTLSFRNWSTFFSCFSAFLFGFALFLSLYISIRISSKNLEG